MKIRLSVRGRAGQATNLQVTADATATVGDVAAALASAGPLKAGDPVDSGTVTLRVLDPDGAHPPTVLTPVTPLDESGLGSGDVVDLAPVPKEHAHAMEAAVVQVLSGPDAGTSFPLPPGSTEVGRSRHCGVVLNDPLVSKRHMRITVGTQVEVHDLNSANGVTVADQRVQRLAVSTQDVVTVGETSLRISLLTTASNVPGTRSGSGSTDVPYLRSPRVIPRTPHEKITLPAPPRFQPAQRFPLLALVAPLVMGAGMYLFSRNVMSLVFVGLSPVLMIGTWAEQRLRRRQEWKRDRRRFAEAVVDARANLVRVFARERQARTAQYPSVNDVYADVMGLGPALWCRRPEHP